MSAVDSLMNAHFPVSNSPLKYLSGKSQGVDIVVSAGGNVETEAATSYFADFKIAQIHTVSTDTALNFGASFPYKLQTTPVDSFEGIGYNKFIYSFSYYNTTRFHFIVII